MINNLFLLFITIVFIISIRSIKLLLPNSALFSAHAILNKHTLMQSIAKIHVTNVRAPFFRLNRIFLFDPPSSVAFVTTDWLKNCHTSDGIFDSWNSSRQQPDVPLFNKKIKNKKKKEEKRKEWSDALRWRQRSLTRRLKFNKLREKRGNLGRNKITSIAGAYVPRVCSV